MNTEESIYFRDQLRNARAIALADAEGFQEILFCIERLGSYICRKTGTLGTYKKMLLELAEESALASIIPEKHNSWHTSFERLYDELREARNAALHQGVRARHLTSHAVQITLVLEDAIMSDKKLVNQFMVKEVVQTDGWQPISYVRHQMLERSISCVPLRNRKRWNLITETALAKYLGRDKKDRKNRLMQSVDDACINGLKLDKADTIYPDDQINDIIDKLSGYPLLVVDKNDEGRLLGILTAFDII